MCDYTKFKTDTAPLIGAANEPIGQKTRFAWTIISPGKEEELSPMFLYTNINDRLRQFVQTGRICMDSRIVQLVTKTRGIFRVQRAN